MRAKAIFYRMMARLKVRIRGRCDLIQMRADVIF